MKRLFQLLVFLFLSNVVQAQSWIPDAVKRHFLNGVKIDKNLVIPRDTTATTDSGAISIKDGAMYLKWGNHYRIAQLQDTSNFLASKTYVQEVANEGGGVGGLSGGNLGYGWRWYDPDQQALRTFNPDETLLFDTLTDGELRAAVDTALMSTRAWRQKGLDSLGALKLNISDTVGMIVGQRFGLEDNVMTTFRRIKATGATDADRKFYYDSVQHVLTVKFGAGGNDTALVVKNSAGTVQFMIAANGTVIANGFRTTSNSFSAATGSFSQLNQYLRFVNPGYISAYQQPLKILRQYPSVGNDSTIATILLVNDTLRGNPLSVPAIDSTKAMAVLGKWVSQRTNAERTTFKIFHNGSATFNEQGWSSAYFRLRGSSSTTIFYSTASTNNIGIGTESPNASAILDVSSTEKGFLLPRMSETLRDAILSPATGLMVYNTTANKLNVYNGSSWVELNVGSGSAVNNANVGSGFRLVKPDDQGIKTLYAGNGITIDSTTNTNGITITSTAPNLTVQTLTDGSTITWDVSQGVNAQVTLGGTGRTLSISNAVAGQTYTIRVIQDGTGSRTITTWPTNTKWPGGIGPALSTGAGKYDIVVFYFDGTNFYGTYQLDFQ